MHNFYKSYKSLFVTFFLFILLTNCSESTTSADLVLLNGKIISVDSNNSIYEAIAIRSDTIMALGSNELIKKFIGDSTKTIDLKNATIIPGFIDSHAHLIGTGQSLMNLDLSTAKNWDEVVLMVAQTASKLKNGEWIIGRGWHQEKWNAAPRENIEGFPLHKELSEATPDNPVLLSHASGHAIFANAYAMNLANISNDTKDPDGGTIIRDEEGNPIGVFSEEAAGIIYKKYNESLSQKTKQELDQSLKHSIKLTNDECIKNGITTFHDAGISFKELNILREMIDSNQIDIRLYEMLGENYEMLKDSLRKYQVVGYGKNHLTVRSIKIYMDGALGSRGAWFLEPYTDMPEHYGLNTTPISEIKSIVKLAAENDFQVCTHAIGDRGNREILNIYENEQNNYSTGYNFRWRIEHAQHLNPADIERFSQLGVIASMQGIHCTSDAPFVEKRLGKDRAENGAYVWQSLIKSGAIICNGTDSPVESINPLQNYYATVTRKTKDGNYFYENQKMTRIEALRSYTINGAYAAFEENIKGSLEVGKLADITVLSKDILTIPDDEILNTEVLYTIIGGKICYAK
ncbi:MAG: amidohydrolase [Ignavibacteriales bacterium]|nr:amidohydrolase [Ignavibacteriales bacterium]